MKLITLNEAQGRLAGLVKQAQRETIGLTNEEGDLVGLLTGVDEDSLDDILVQTPGFRAMIERSRASMDEGPLISADELLAEAKARLRAERRERRGRKG